MSYFQHDDGKRMPDDTTKHTGLERMNDPMTDRVLRITGIVYALFLAVIIIDSNRDFYHDDAYITLRYAKNCIAGLGIVWNAGEYVQGYTNFLHLIFISGLGKFGIDLVWASRIVGMTALVGLLGVMLLLGVTFKSERGAPLWHLPAILVVTSVPMLVWSLGGLEGTLFSLLVAGGSLLFLAATDASTKHWLFATSGLLFGFSFLTRPDSIVFVTVSLGWLFWESWKNKPKAYFHLMAYAVGVAIVLTPYVVWQASYYGDVVPNTFYVRMGAPLRLRLDSGVPYVVDYAVRPPFLPILVFISLAYAFLKRCWSSKLTYLALSVSAYVIFIIWAGGDHMQSFRLLLPVVPLMGALLAMALSPSIEANGTLTVNNITLAIIIATTLQVPDDKLNPRREDTASFVGTIVGKFIAEKWPDGSVVALNTAGSTPYHAGQHRYIDMLGLNDPAIAKRKISKLELPWQSIPGHLKGDGAYVLSRRPDFIIVGPAEGTVASSPWFLSDLELNADPRFRRDYALFQVTLDDSGRPVAGGGLTFTYYKRIDGQDGSMPPNNRLQRHGAGHRR